MQAQGPNQQMDVTSLNFRSIVKTMQVVIKYEQNAEKKANCVNVLNKFLQSKNSSLLKELDRENQQRLVEIRTMLKLYRNAFQKITEREEYKQFKIANGLIAEQLLAIQDKVDPKDYKTSYFRAITIKKKQFNWTKELIQDWMKAFQEERCLEQEKTKQKQIDKSRQIKNQTLHKTTLAELPQNPFAQSIVSQLNFQQKKAGLKSGQKSSQKLQGQKPQKKIKKDETADKGQKDKKGVKGKKEVEDSESSENQAAKQLIRKKAEKQGKERIGGYQRPKQPKNRVKALMDYLTARKDLGLSSGHKAKQLAEYLNNSLQKFMKHHLANLIQIAKLRNRKHHSLPSSGNQFTYFSKEAYITPKPINHLQLSHQPPRMLKLNYRSKFELYSMLRARQEALEDGLLKLYAARKDTENNKATDKRLWEYLLRPNHLVEKTQQYTEIEEARTDRLSIEITHIRYLFESHKFIRNSWLMLNCYNS